MKNHAAATAPTPKPDPRDFCKSCGKPIELTVTNWIPFAGVDAGVECAACQS